MRERARRSVYFLVIVAVVAAPSVSSGQLTIEPVHGDENPVAVGQRIRLSITGLEDPSMGRVTVWPPASILPILTEGIRANSWYGWGNVPEIIFYADAPGRYRVGVLEEASGADQWAEYIVEVGDGPGPNPTILISPVEPFSSAGEIGGPFSPRIKTYSVAAPNPGWEVTADVGWVSVTPHTGQDAKGSVDVIINPEAEKLLEGTHKGSLVFTSGTARGVREVYLTVGNDPGPNPNPDPPTPGKLHVLIVYESDQNEETQPDYLTSLILRRYLDTHCDTESLMGGQVPTYRMWDIDSDVSGQPADWRTAFNRARDGHTSLPWITVSNGVDSFDGPLPDDVTGVVELLQKYGGK